MVLNPIHNIKISNENLVANDTILLRDKFKFYTSVGLRLVIPDGDTQLHSIFGYKVCKVSEVNNPR